MRKDAKHWTCPDCGGPKYRTSARCMTCAGKVPTVPPEDRPFPMWSGERAEYGCIVTFENADRKTLTLHKTGPPRRAAEELCDQALALDETFRIVSISSPELIYTDMKGYRLDGEGRPGFAQVPETHIMRGRYLELVHERLKR